MNLLERLSPRSSGPVRADLAGRPLSRRAMLSPAAVLSAMWASAARGGPPPRTTDPNIWLVHHLTMGLAEQELTQVNAFGYYNYLEHQLDYEALEEPSFDERLASYATLTMEPYELLPLPAGQVIAELTEATLLRSVFSKRQLYERMVEFWTDHFNIDITNGLDRWLKTVDDREVIRPHALGTFPELLSASAHSPAMLYYLDNTASVAGDPNENYARELMELHTMGVDGGYTQHDVVEVARCFTGWGMYLTGAGVDNFTFRFDLALHDDGEKIVLGRVIPEGGGITDGESVLWILAHHPSTARFISRKLCEWLWGYDPPPSLVDGVAAVYAQTGGDIKALVRAVFYSQEALELPIKYKRPYHLIISALRATHAVITSTTALRQVHLAAAGHEPFSWGPPNGYPDGQDYWTGLVLPRWNFGSSLFNNAIAGVTVQVDAILWLRDTAQEIVDRIDAALFGGAMPPMEKTLIRDYLLPDPPTLERKRDAIGLAISSPGFQWY